MSAPTYSVHSGADSYVAGVRTAPVVGAVAYLLWEHDGGQLWTTPSLTQPPLPAYASDVSALADARQGLGNWQWQCSLAAAGSPADWPVAAGYLALPGARCVAVWTPDGWHYGDPAPYARVALGLSGDIQPDAGWSDALAALPPHLAAILDGGAL